MLVPRVFRPGERELLDLVELVDADHPAGVAAGGARLAAEAGRERDVPQRQLGGVEDLAGVQAGERDLGRAGEVEPVVRELVDVHLVGRKRAGADERPLADEDRRQHGDEPFRGEPLERERVEGEREAGRVADPVAEAGAGHPCGPLHVEAADVDVLAGALRRARLADATHLLDVVLGRAVGDVRMRQVGDTEGSSSRAASAAAYSSSAARSCSLTCCSSASCSGEGLPFSFVFPRSSSSCGTSVRQRSSAASSASNASPAPLRASAAR